MRKLILAALVTALLAGNAFALPVNVKYDNAVSNNTAPLGAYVTTGAMMEAMTVDVSYSGNAFSGAWSSDMGTGGYAAVGGAYLSQSGDTFGGLWHLRNTGQVAFTKLIIDAGAGNSVFDVISNPNLSPGSARGWGFTVSAASGLSGITATYSGAVTVDNVLYGDLFRYLILEFEGGFGSQSTLSFITDTDSVSDILGTTNLSQLNKSPEAVPEPSTLIMLGSGLAGLLLYRRKRRS